MLKQDHILGQFLQTLLLAQTVSVPVFDEIRRRQGGLPTYDRVHLSFFCIPGFSNLHILSYVDALIFGTSPDLGFSPQFTIEAATGSSCK